MCGIVGIAVKGRSDRVVSYAMLERMRDTLVHRGPDDFGVYVSNSAGLGHRRLSIVDVASGHQPMTNESGSLRIVFNGEIYNHTDYRPKLQALGHCYQTNSDT